MKYLARLILSIENFIKNPTKWFGNRSWIFKVFAVLLFIPIISATSIFSYQNIYEFNKSGSDSDNDINSKDLGEIKDTLERYHDSQVEEMLYLREEMIELKKSVKNGGDESDEVLGAEDSTEEPKETTEALQKRLEEFLPKDQDNPDLKSVYIRTDDENVAMYKLPSKSSEQITDFKVGIFYPALEKKGNWQEIDFGNGSTAWIDTKYIITFPIDENH